MIKKGFTLLEMLVVIGIIAILVSLGFASYSTVQKKARDAKRKGDLSAMQKVLEQCYSVSSYSYPAITGGGSIGPISTNCTALGGPSITFIDPTTKTYTVTGGAGATYSVSVTLEDTTVYTISNQQ
ncbi:MAG: prepilin-type N-terminal cleavage/methylation domain-containing protein [Candidatus Roizmanbacteria bacterium]|nr:prepilin-type N-terminal cleavage/methylation domain-containing protein [Candidatus Roizmanbacteria bacterium]